MSTEFLLTSLIVVLIPGTGVIFTISNGLFLGKKASIASAVGCTLGIVPHLLASMFGLATILYTSAVAFQVVKIIGVMYLFYLAYMMYKETGVLNLENNNTKAQGLSKIALRAFLINILNPKLTIFFMAFIPQFISPNSTSVLSEILILSLTFMFMTFVVFCLYGVFAHKSKQFIQNSPKIMNRIQKTFAGLFVFFGAKLALAER